MDNEYWGNGAPQGTFVHPITGATSTTPQDGYVFVPQGYQLQQTGGTGYSLVDVREAYTGALPTGYNPFKQYEQPVTDYGKITTDPFDLKIREAAISDLLTNRRTTSRQSTFTTGPRGIQGPAKTVLG